MKSKIEKTLDLDRIDTDIFVGPIVESHFIRTFGGQIAAQTLVAELPILVGQLLDGVVELGDVVVVGHERAVATAAVVGTVRDRALTGGCAEDAGPA